MENGKYTGFKLECPECLEKFDELERKPKALPCGHSFCLKCLESVDRCFIDKKDFIVLPYELPDNHNVKAMLRSNLTTSAKSVHVWCVDCNKPAKERCIGEKHKIASRKTVLFEQLFKKLNLTENPLHPQTCQKFVESLTENETAEALQMLRGQVAPVDILMKGSTSRWMAELLPQDCKDSKEAKVLKGILFLMRQKGLLPKEVLMTTKVEEPEEKPFVDPEIVLDLTNISSCKDLAIHSAEKKEFFSANRLLKIRRLLGLYCDRDKEWSLKLLKSLAPVLEELHIYNFSVEHLKTILDMPELRWLVLEFPTFDPKERVELTSLQHESKVEFLWVNIPDRRRGDNLNNDIVKMYQASVEILFVEPPVSYAVEFFDGLDLPNLKVLLYGSSYCGMESCYESMVGLCKRFPNIKIVCMRCERMNDVDKN